MDGWMDGKNQGLINVRSTYYMHVQEVKKNIEKGNLQHTQTYTRTQEFSRKLV